MLPMARKATTVRLDPAVQEGLSKLSALLRRPQNQLVNEAVQEFVAKRALGLVDDWQSTLARLKAYREQDPTGEKSLRKAMLAEAALEHDPAEGKRLVEKPKPRKSTSATFRKMSG
jgi:predicted transcriptional regulator